jgi:hypothetical protein
MSLPPLFPYTNNFDVPFRKSDGVTNPDQTIIEPGCFFDTTINDVGTASYPPVAQVTDYEITGTFVSSATWTIVITPLTTQAGTAAAAHAQAAATVTYVATAQSAADTVTGINAAINASITTVALGMSISNAATYVIASVGATTAKIRLTARTPGATFSAVITSSLAGDSYTATTITNPVTATVKVGLYYAIDTTKGTDGFDAQGRPYLTKVTSSTAAADIIGPIFKGADTKQVDRGFAYREYEVGQNIPFVRYGHVSAYADRAIPLSSGPEAVFVRHTDAGDYLAGMASNAAGATAGATANVWTGTPTSANDTVFTMTIAFGSVVQTLTYLSDVGSSATEIATGLRAELVKVNAAVGQPLYGLTGSGTATFIITGPADGRGFTPVNVGVGVVAWVETTAEVSTHTLLTRGDKFIAPSTRIGPSRVAVPVTPIA